MRPSALFVLAACGVSSTGTRNDAAIDAVPRQDTWTQRDAPLDAYVRRACDAPPLFADGLVPTRVLHVSPGASNGDGSATAPFGSIAAAAAVATPGTFIQLAPGIHATNQFLPALRGTADAPIWIGGVYGTHPIIRGGAEGLHLTRPAYVVIQHLQIDNQYANGINIDDGVSYGGDAHHVAIVDVRVGNVWTSGTEACVRAAGVSDLAIYDSQFRECAIGIDLIGTHRSVVARNLLDDVVLYAVQTRGGSTDIDIRQNRIFDGNSGVVLGGSTPLAHFRPPVSTATPNSEARRIRAFDNLVAGTTYVPFSFVSCVDCLVAHNLTYGSARFLVRIAQGTTTQNGYVFEPTRDGRVINNAFVWTMTIGPPHVDVGPDTEPTTFTFSHNLWYATQSPTASTPVLPVTETGSVIGQGTGYSFDITYPYCGGPEQNAAAPLPEIDGTIEGHCRSDGDAPTIGPQVHLPDDCLL